MLLNVNKRLLGRCRETGNIPSLASGIEDEGKKNRGKKDCSK